MGTAAALDCVCRVCREQSARPREARITPVSLRVKCALALVRGARRALFVAALVVEQADDLLAPFDRAETGV